MNLSIGILIVGSLYWDSEGGRERWRDWRLDMEQTWTVKAPIRYGRTSSSRDDTYTMVFSKLAPDKFGRAIVVKCRNTVRGIEDLLTEARWLWTAEKKSVPNVKTGDLCTDITSRDWGRVALLSKPSGCIRTVFHATRKSERETQDLLDEWAEHAGPADDALMIDKSGQLQIGWPDCTERPVPLDLLMATSNNQDEKLPNAESVAAAWNLHPGRRNYFDENRKYGIRTFQDDQILKYLR